MKRKKPPAARRHAAKKKSGGLRHWKVKFTRRGMEPPRPFGKTTAVVCAESREAAREMVPASPHYPITVSATTDPVSFTYRCHHTVEDEILPSEASHASEAHAIKKKSPAQLDREIAAVLGSKRGHSTKREDLSPRERILLRTLNQRPERFPGPTSPVLSVELRDEDVAKSLAARKLLIIAKDDPSAPSGLLWVRLTPSGKDLADEI